jgi:hypothetical protein
MRKALVLATAMAVVAALSVPQAQAHVLYLSKAHHKSVGLTKYVCDGTQGCERFHVDPCHRMSAHKVRCKSHIFGEEQGRPVECTYVNQWSIRRGSDRLHYSFGLFNRTLQCS